ncbi:MAG: bifunctional 4-hydroxy-3-methylbut-2-enyl diphosphate reductase/30S ribosomal protein S1, partial [Candidatus Marinimicrobia bacterium]|nr:bifunctional 4-hydroxy-3-methylbut-2-enyl diphosphate reductase/30S ribosomal protein S1 [Candidatus Neomarinimicrobiota bacterium]
DAIVVADADEARNLGKLKKVGVVSQSTQTLENVQKIITVLLEKTVDLRFVNTICYPTRRNQMQISELAEKYDLMIVIGSFTSANSKRLAEISEKINPKTYQVACEEDLKKKWFDGAQTVGIGAGASTPDSIIETVKLKIEELKK